MEKTNKEIDLKQYIEHTLLKQEATLSEVEQLCAEAVEHGFYGVCVPPYFVEAAVKFLNGAKPKVISVVGFPLGYNPISVKVEEAKKAFERGAHEVDMVMNIAAFKSGDFNQVKNDIESVTTIAHMQDKVVKVIIESGILSEKEINKACEICAEAGVDFVKTSTGFAAAGASTEHIKMMRKLLPAKVKIKASGGIKTHAQAMEMVEAGADRIGSSSGVKLLE
ncbi:MAG: deoxyribose-phosphate aldolase [Chitinophagales bacterium]|nr:deoxyribose-phosphate aldolase [Chitinophagales bacterium]